MKRLTLVTMQLKTPGGIERFISTLATMFANDFKVEIVVNYGKPSEPLAFPLPKNVKLTFLTPKKPKIRYLKTISPPLTLITLSPTVPTTIDLFPNITMVMLSR